MSAFTDRILETIGIVTKSELSKVRSRAYEAGFNDGEDEPILGDVLAGGGSKYGYRRLTTNHLRDFSNMTRSDILESVWSLWQSSPIAKRILTLKRDHIMGNGVVPTTEESDLQEILDAFWKRNNMDKRSKEFALQLFLFGEQCHTEFVKESDGRIMQGYVDPGLIEDIIPHPHRPMDMWAVLLQETKDTRKWVDDREKEIYKIIREAEPFVGIGEDGLPTIVEPEWSGLMVTHLQAELEPWEEVMLASLGKTEYDGSCLFTKVNSVSNQPRGYSDLMQVTDWIDQADETLFSLADREQMASYFSWDVLLEGADDEEVNERKKELQGKPPKKGTVKVHNESEIWTFVYPDLKTSGTVATFRALLGFILGGVGYPVHWYAFGDDANRATAVAQGDPTEKSLEHDQGIVQDMLIEQLNFVRDQAVIAGEIGTEMAEVKITVAMPEITMRDLSRAGALVSQLAAALINAKDTGLMTKETAVRIWLNLLREFGVPIDEAEELENLENDFTEDEVTLLEWAREYDGLNRKHFPSNGS